MKQVIYKYDMLFQSEFRLKVPLGSRILFIEKQYEIPKIWMIVNPGEERTEVRDFIMIPTGQEYDSKGLVYVGSVIMTNDWGAHTYHYFEIIMPI